MEPLRQIPRHKLSSIALHLIRLMAVRQPTVRNPIVPQNLASR